jgi:hypothetical protein
MPPPDEKEETPETADTESDEDEDDDAEDTSREQKELARMQSAILASSERIRTVSGDPDFITSDDPILSAWVGPYNNMVNLFRSTFPLDFSDPATAPVVRKYGQEYMRALVEMSDGDVTAFAGFPVWSGVAIHLFAGKKRPKTPWMDEFRKRMYGTIGEDPNVENPQYIIDCALASIGREDTPQGWLKFGKWLLARRAAGFALTDDIKIESKASFRPKGKYQGMTVTVYNAITPDGVFVLPHYFWSHGHTRGLEVFLKTCWGIENFSVEQEERAMEKLRGMVNDDQWRQYVVGGMFEEHSRASGVSYMLRRLRPTVALRRFGHAKGRYKYVYLAGLCTHPLAYNVSSFAGSLCPTDDVCDHLLWIRGDERRFWSRANHHTLEEVEGGLP